MTQFSLIPAAEAPDLAREIQTLFDELAASLSQEQRVYSGEYHPSVDVLETEGAVEVVVDVAGVSLNAIRILFRADVLIVAGEKAPPMTGKDHAFHLVEREFGRFVRAVRLSGAYDVARSRATLRDGELSIVLPKIVERRGGAHYISITRAGEPRG
jgi:HSP20 family protein